MMEIEKEREREREPGEKRERKREREGERSERGRERGGECEREGEGAGEKTGGRATSKKGLFLEKGHLQTEISKRKYTVFVFALVHTPTSEYTTFCGNWSKSLEIRSTFNDKRKRGHLSKGINTLIRKEKEHVSKDKR